MLDRKYYIIVKKIFALSLIIIGFSCFKKKDESSINKIVIKCISWKSKYGRIHNVKNFHKTYEYCFSTNEVFLDRMFTDYEDFLSKITSQKMLFKDSGNVIVYALVEIEFNKRKKVELYFNWNGDYCFNGNWYHRNSGLYYEFFKFFSDELFSQELLSECKKINEEGLWINE